MVDQSREGLASVGLSFLFHDQDFLATLEAIGKRIYKQENPPKIRQFMEVQVASTLALNQPDGHRRIPYIAALEVSAVRNGHSGPR